MQNAENSGAYQQSKHLESRKREIWSPKASSATCSRPASKRETQSQYRKKEKNSSLFYSLEYSLYFNQNAKLIYNAITFAIRFRYTNLIFCLFHFGVTFPCIVTKFKNQKGKGRQVRSSMSSLIRLEHIRLYRKKLKWKGEEKKKPQARKSRYQSGFITTSLTLKNIEKHFF